jgi:hypothetical protein
MTRHEESDDGSLDLLLDTICNTFGGVLFISMLVVILLSMTSEQVDFSPPSETSQEDLVQLNQKLERERKEMESLEREIKQQQQIEKQIVDPRLRELVLNLKTSQHLRTNLVKRRSQELEEISDAQIEVNEIAQFLHDLSQQLQLAESDFATRQQRLEQEIKSRTRNVKKLPKARQTTKVELPFFLHEGRLCSYAKRGADGVLQPNPTEVEERTDAQGKLFLSPKSGAGLLVDSSGANQQSITQKLNQFDKGQHYIAVFVRPDSFGNFPALRQLLVAAEFEYRLVPVSADEDIYIGAADGTAEVQ